MAQNHDEFWHFEHDAWNGAAANYARCWSGLTTQYVDPLLAAVGTTANKRLLDVACGPGYVSRRAKEVGASPTGIDFSPRMIDLARRENPGVDFREGDAQELPFESNSFDAVAMNFGVLHLSEPERAFAEAFRVLRPGGRYGFTVWAGPEGCGGAKAITDVIQTHADMDIDLPKGPPSERFADEEECRCVLEAAGFEPRAIAFEAVTVDWEIPGADFLFEAETRAGVRTAALLAAQSPEVLKTIEIELAKVTDSFNVDGRVVLPMTAYVVSTAKPAA